MLGIENNEDKAAYLRDIFKEIIIVKDGPTHYNEFGILILNLFDFLLKENSLEY